MVKKIIYHDEEFILCWLTEMHKLNSMGFAFPLIQEFGFRHTVQMDDCGGCGLPVHVVSLAVLPQTESRVRSTEGHTAAVSVCHICNATHALRNLEFLCMLQLKPSVILLRRNACSVRRRMIALNFDTELPEADMKSSISQIFLKFPNNASSIYYQFSANLTCILNLVLKTGTVEY